jgi:hypothetical protein
LILGLVLVLGPVLAIAGSGSEIVFQNFGFDSRYSMITPRIEIRISQQPKLANTGTYQGCPVIQFNPIINMYN